MGVIREQYIEDNKGQKIANSNKLLFLDYDYFYANLKILCNASF
jgi:hypothetical protein